MYPAHALLLTFGAVPKPPFWMSWKPYSRLSFGFSPIVGDIDRSRVLAQADLLVCHFFPW